MIYSGFFSCVARNNELARDVNIIGIAFFLLILRVYNVWVILQSRGPRTDVLGQGRAVVVVSTPKDTIPKRYPKTKFDGVVVLAREVMHSLVPINQCPRKVQLPTYLGG